MNKTYRTIWSKVREAYVVVAEIVAGNGGPSRGKAAAIKAAARGKVAAAVISTFLLLGRLEKIN